MNTDEEQQQYKADLEAQAVDSAVAEAERVAGGPAQLVELRRWASENLAPDDLAKWNKRVKNVADQDAYPDFIRHIEGQKAMRELSAREETRNQAAAAAAVAQYTGAS